MKPAAFTILLFTSGSFMLSCKTQQILETSTVLEISQNQNTIITKDTIIPDIKLKSSFLCLAEEHTKQLVILDKTKKEFQNISLPVVERNIVKKKPNKLLKVKKVNNISWSSELEVVGLISFILTVIAYGIVLIPLLYTVAIVISIIALLFGLISLIRFATSNYYYGKGFPIAAILLCVFFLLFLFVIFPATFHPFG